MKTRAAGVAQHDARLDEVIRDLAHGVHTQRLRRGMTTTVLAMESGLSESTVRAVESGRVSASLASLVALADGLGVPVADLFGAGGSVDEVDDDPAMRSIHVVPSEVVWGGDLPPAPWLAVGSSPTAGQPERDAAAVAAPIAPVTPIAAPAAAAQTLPTEHTWAAGLPAAEHTWAAGLPAAPWATAPEQAPVDAALPDDYPVRAATDAAGPVPAARYGEDVVTVPSAAQTVAPRVHHLSAARGMYEASAYVFVSPDAVIAAANEPAPRTFADLRKGVLAGRSFPSLREFAVAAIVEAGQPIPVIARMFRVPVWRLEQWVAEAGSAEGSRTDRP